MDPLNIGSVIAIAERLTGNRFDFDTAQIARAEEGWGPVRPAAEREWTIAEIDVFLSNFEPPRDVLCKTYNSDSFDKVLEVIGEISYALWRFAEQPEGWGLELAASSLDRLRAGYKEIVTQFADCAIHLRIFFEESFLYFRGINQALWCAGIFSAHDFSEMIERIAAIPLRPDEIAPVDYLAACRLSFVASSLRDIINEAQTAPLLLEPTTCSVLYQILREGAVEKVKNAGQLEEKRGLRQGVNFALCEVASVCSLLRSSAFVIPDEFLSELSQLARDLITFLNPEVEYEVSQYRKRGLDYRPHTDIAVPDLFCGLAALKRSLPSPERLEINCAPFPAFGEWITWQFRAGNCMQLTNLPDLKYCGVPLQSAAIRVHFDKYFESNLTPENVRRTEVEVKNAAVALGAGIDLDLGKLRAVVVLSCLSGATLDAESLPHLFEHGVLSSEVCKSIVSDAPGVNRRLLEFALKSQPDWGLELLTQRQDSLDYEDLALILGAVSERNDLDLDGHSLPVRRIGEILRRELEMFEPFDPSPPDESAAQQP